MENQLKFQYYGSFGRPKFKLWSREEDDLLTSLFLIYGTSWTRYIGKIPGRSINAIKCHWRVLKRRNKTVSSPQMDIIMNHHFDESEKSKQLELSDSDIQDMLCAITNEDHDMSSFDSFTQYITPAELELDNFSSLSSPTYGLPIEYVPDNKISINLALQNG